MLSLCGATGDLARRKLLPGLLHLDVAGMMWPHHGIVGSGRPEAARDADGFRSEVRATIAESGRRELTYESWGPFARNLSFAPASSEQPDGLVAIREVFAPLLEQPPMPLTYIRGSWSPDAIDQLISTDRWHLPDTDKG
jgi:glucose-6-phosphate 1-dehydrogenase